MSQDVFLNLRVIVDDSDPERVAAIVAFGTRITDRDGVTPPEGGHTLASALATIITQAGFSVLWTHHGAAFEGYEVTGFDDTRSRCLGNLPAGSEVFVAGGDPDMFGVRVLGGGATEDGVPVEIVYTAGIPGFEVGARFDLSVDTPAYPILTVAQLAALTPVPAAEPTHVPEPADTDEDTDENGD